MNGHNCWTSHHVEGGRKVKTGDTLVANDSEFGLTEGKEYYVLVAMFNEVQVENDNDVLETYSVEYFNFKTNE